MDPVVDAARVASTEVPAEPPQPTVDDHAATDSNDPYTSLTGNWNIWKVS